MNFKYLTITLSLVLFSACSDSSQSTQDAFRDDYNQIPYTKAQKEGVVVYELYHGRECPHCQKLQKWIDEEFRAKYPNVRIEKYEVWHNQENHKRMQARYEELGYPAPTGVPANIINGIALQGFGTGEKIIQAVEKAQEKIDNPSTKTEEEPVSNTEEAQVEESTDQ